jgi:hypothetical protein
MGWREALGLAPGVELKAGASNEDDEYYGMSQASAARLAQEIIDTPQVEHLQRAVDLEREFGRANRPRRNRHLDGYGDPRRS